MVVTLSRGLIAPLTSTHEPSSMLFLWNQPFPVRVPELRPARPRFFSREVEEIEASISTRVPGTEESLKKQLSQRASVGLVPPSPTWIVGNIQKQILKNSRDHQAPPKP